MRTNLTGAVAVLAAVALAGCQRAEEPAAEQPIAEEATKPEISAFQVPVRYRTLDNGLKVILSQDTTSPIVTVAVYYNIGFRIEPAIDREVFRSANPFILADESAGGFHVPFLAGDNDRRMNKRNRRISVPGDGKDARVFTHNLVGVELEFRRFGLSRY